MSLIRVDEDYYNTNHECGDVLERSQKKAKGQENLILKCFKKWDADPTLFKFFSPCQVHKEIEDIALLSSVRRTMTDLTRKGYLVKTHVMIAGKYGKQVHTWRLNK